MKYKSLVIVALFFAIIGCFTDVYAQKTSKTKNKTKNQLIN